jgi:hypothetical protein
MPNSPKDNLLIDEGFDDASPAADALVESMRNLGYTTEAAIADLVDNSIYAKAKRINVHFEWEGAKSWAAVIDDGCGMGPKKLVQSMRPGSQNPLEIRNKDDLGRFGLGLKTASFSQARKLAVMSRSSEDKPWEVRCWDLDHVQKTGLWQLARKLPDDFKPKQLPWLPDGKGTVVLWIGLDRITGKAKPDDENSRGHFFAMVDRIRQHLEMVFHRLVGGRLNISVNGNELEGWDPFMTYHRKTEPQPEETLEKGKIKIKPYVLPHRNELTEDEFQTGAGPRRWNDHQGFYVYRNRRLLVSGSWLGLRLAKEEHHKLARIRIDLPNDLDQEWQIDLKKSLAIPPGRIEKQLKRVAQATRKKAMEVYRHRGKQVSRKASQDNGILWKISQLRTGAYSFKINREHLMISGLKKAHPAMKKGIDEVLRAVEAAIPIEAMVVQASEQPELRTDPIAQITVSQRKKMVESMFNSLVEVGETPQAAFDTVCRMEPFNLMTAELALLAEGHGLRTNF